MIWDNNLGVEERGRKAQCRSLSSDSRQENLRPRIRIDREVRAAFMFIFSCCSYTMRRIKKK